MTIHPPPAPESGHPPRLDLRRLGEVPAALQRQLDAGARTLLCSRYSTDGGSRARELAVRGIYSAATVLALRHGVDLREWLPPQEELLTRLTTRAEVIVSPRPGGGTFRNFAYLYDEQAEHGLVVLVQYGTGVTVDEAYHQPAVDRAARAITDWNPALVYANEVRGWGRVDFALGPLAFALEEVSRRRGTPVHLGAVRQPLEPLSRRLRRQLFEDGQLAEAEAEATSIRTRIAWRERTGQDRGRGRFTYAKPGALPTPLDVVRVADAAHPLGEPIAYVDTPVCRPPGAIARADQLALLRWFYRHYLTPGWDPRACASYLVAHGFSTMGSRWYRRDPNGHPLLRSGSDGRGDANKLCRSILRDRAFHRTGKLRFDLHDGAPPIEVRVDFPGGPPCREADAARIRTAERQRASLRPRRRVHTFAGQPVTIDDVAAALVVAHHRPPDDVAFAFQRVRPGQPRSRYSPAPVLRHASIAAAILRALTTGPLLLDADLDGADEEARLLAALTLAQADWDRARHDLERAKAHSARPDHSERTFAAARRALDVAAEEEVQAEARVTACRADLAAGRDHASAPGLAVAKVLQLIRSLRDPRSTTFRDLLRRDVTGFVVTTHPEPGPRDHRRTALEFHFTLTVRDAQGRRWRLPVAGTQAAGAGRSRLLDRLGRAVAGLRQGRTAWQTLGPGYRELTPYLRAALGQPPGRPSVLLNVTDPRCLRLGMALLHPEPRRPAPTGPWAGTGPDDVPALVGSPLSPAGLRALATATGEPLTLLRHLQHVYTHPRGRTGRWLRDPAPVLAALLRDAGAGVVPLPRVPGHLRGHLDPAWFEVTAAGVRTRACPRCGSRRRSRPLIPEMTGLVCRRCRRDDAGHRWPAREYDRYLDGVEATDGAGRPARQHPVR